MVTVNLETTFEGKTKKRVKMKLEKYSVSSISVSSVIIFGETIILELNLKKRGSLVYIHQFIHFIYLFIDMILSPYSEK